MIINEKYNKLFNCKYKRKLRITNEYKDISKNNFFSENQIIINIQILKK